MRRGEGWEVVYSIRYACVLKQVCYLSLDVAEVFCFHCHPHRSKLHMASDGNRALGVCTYIAIGITT